MDRSTHLAHFDGKKNYNSIVLSDVDHSTRVIREGDAQDFSAFKINNQTLKPDDNCEFCTEVVYSPGKRKFAAIAYQVNNTDLTLARRVVFFAKGDGTGEQVLFLAAGKDIRNMSTPIDGIDGNYFPNKAFGVMTKGVNLTNHWKRYEIGLYNGFTTGITYPFGFVITSKNSTSTQKFFLKGVSFDDKYPVNGLSTDWVLFKD